MRIDGSKGNGAEVVAILPPRQGRQPLGLGVPTTALGDSSKSWFVFSVFGGWGDVFMVSGVAREIKQANPGARIEYHLPRHQQVLLEGNPDFDLLLPEQTAIAAPTGFVPIAYPDQFNGTWRTPGWHWIRVVCQAAGVSFDPYTLRRTYYARPDELLWASDFLGKYERPWTFAHPFSSPWTKLKQWSRTNWADVVDDIPGTTFVVGKDDQGNEPFAADSGNVVSLQEQHTFRETAALLHYADLVVCMDSSIAHAAEAAGAKHVITLFGATTPQMVGLFMPGAVNLEPRRRPCDKSDECWLNAKDCPAPAPCVNLITPAEVKRAIGNVYDPPAHLPLEFVIVNWNSSQLTTRVLQDLARNCQTTGYHVTVVDNGSDRADVAAVRAALSQYHRGRSHLIANTENRGFPAAVNDGLAQSAAEVICLLNPDIEIYEPGWDRRLLAMFDAVPRAGIVGAGKTEGAYFFGAHKDICKRGSSPIRCDRVNGATMAIHRRCLDKVPWMDEMYTPGLCEETDYCVRAQALGLEVWWMPAEIIHLGGQTIAGNDYSWSANHQRNVDVFDRRWRNFQMPFTGHTPKGY